MAALPSTCRPAFAVALGLAALLAGAGPAAHGAENGRDDPLEPVNRVSHQAGLLADRIALGPAARLYRRAIPRPVRLGISNFVDNLTYPNVILNDFLQGKLQQGVQDTARFVFNTTFGLVGFIDFASAVGLERHDEDFGQTLAKWGVPEVAYLDLAMLGPSSVRDVVDLPIRWRTSLLVLGNAGGAAVPVVLLAAVSLRADADTAIEHRNTTAVDTYVFTREAYRRRREHLIFDARPPDDEDVFGAASTRRERQLLSMLGDTGAGGFGGSPLGASLR